MPIYKKLERLSDALNLWDDFRKFSVPFLEGLSEQEEKLQTDVLFRDCEKKIRAHLLDEVRNFTYTDEKD